MSSDSSEDENAHLLKEATDSEFLQENLYNKDKPIEKPKTKLVSLRKDIEAEDEGSLKFSSGFRSHAEKHLSKLLEEQLDKRLVRVQSDKPIEAVQKKGGVRLFSNSKRSLKIEDDSEIKNKAAKVDRPKAKKAPATEEDFKQLAVSGEDVLLKKDTEHWTNSRKSTVFRYDDAGLELTPN
ncbi:unnamed protein product [Phyllotreta striolata]|uniref:Protein CUSTOS n=1 Tax=Phyllotreta striolata TaxID=444603 RepID=A0A9N9TP51_PHYSR|nr:unnamed protein product [Phyllotreta striolata]